MRRLLPSLFLLILFFSSPFLFGQASGKIAGTVKDKETGEPIPFAAVKIEGKTLGAAADVDGNYVILNVPPGVYSLTASLVGYQKMTVKDIRVNVDFTTKLNFELSSGSIDLPPVIVQGDRNPLIRKDLTNPTVAINAESIQELPVDQISDVIRLQAGVVVSNSGTLHIRGGRSDEIAFTLNGISLNDPYGNQNSIGIATNAVQEVSVSTGTFSAQYGNALSGVVNYVTKEGGEKYTFGVRGYVGDYLSGRDELFSQIGVIQPLNRARTELTVGGPIPIPGDAKFYFSSVFENFMGRLYGNRLYNTTDSYLTRDNFSSTDPRYGNTTESYYFNPYNNTSNGAPTGDGAPVPMNPFTSFNFQGNLSYKFTPTLKLKYEFVYDNGESKSYSNSFKYNPDGVGTNYSDGLVNSIDFTHTVSEKMFYTLKASHGTNRSKYYLYEDYNDPRYLPSIYLRTIGNTFFYAGGTDNYRIQRETNTTGFKADLVAQLFNIHEVKSGFELRLHKLWVESYTIEIGKLSSTGDFATINTSDLLYDSTLQLVRRIPTSPSLYNNYTKYPFNFAFYLQDKIEFESSFILNAGLRYEMFDPASQYNPSLSQNLVDSLFGFITAYNEDAEVKHTLSPRISMSYPITDRAVIRLSYGHFYQIGQLSQLYSNHSNYVTNFGSTPTFGNTNVEPQRSVQYEVGLQQQLTEDFKFDLTAYYKDVKNYIYTQTMFTSTGREYYLLTNLAYSNSRGVTLSFLKKRAPGSMFSASLDYTFSVAEGSRTEPADEIFFSEISGKQSETYLVPLSFDRTHVINATMALTEPDDWNLGVVFSLETGTPYTVSLPSNLVQVRYDQNSDNQPLNWNVNMKFEKFFTLGAFDLTVFLQVENLFDTENEYFVYASSGRALSNVEQVQSAIQFNDLRRRITRGDVGLFGMSQLDGYYSQRPERVGAPREVRLGFSLIFN
ncbi:MAG: TonB-dependent receptor [Ignavibacteriaceae bacterium]|nr:TonB-dependent receptor [Ignavibacteriaceae bacterium]